MRFLWTADYPTRIADAGLPTSALRWVATYLLTVEPVEEDDEIYAIGLLSGGVFAFAREPGALGLESEVPSDRIMTVDDLVAFGRDD